QRVCDSTSDSATRCHAREVRLKPRRVRASRPSGAPTGGHPLAPTGGKDTAVGQETLLDHTRGGKQIALGNQAGFNLRRFSAVHRGTRRSPMFTWALVVYDKQGQPEWVRYRFVNAM